MNTVLLNTFSLDGETVIKKGSGGGGGGIPINNQSKSVEFTENGTSEVRYDAGYTGLEKVSVKVAIPTESKSVTITENGSSEVSASKGYLDKVSINVAIPTEEKTVDITENGTTEVVAANGFLSKVVVNTNVASSGGGGGEYFPNKDDGNTYFYISISDMLSPRIYFSFNQSKANGVQVDFGDGSNVETFAATSVNVRHTYSELGTYCITLSPSDDCTITFKGSSSENIVFGSQYDYVGQGADRGKVVQIELGKNLNINSYAFTTLLSLKKVWFAPYAITCGDYLFKGCSALEESSFPISDSYDGLHSNCKSLKRLYIQEGVKRIGSYALNSSLATSVKIPPTVEVISSHAFYRVSSIIAFDFSHHTFIPTLENTDGLDTGLAASFGGGKIVVPDNLYDDWIATTNWSSLASYIVKESEFNG